MTLKEWLSEKGIEPGAFAERIGRTAESVRRYLNGDRIPDRQTMPLIVAETGGRVTANDFFGIDAADHVDTDTVSNPARSPGNPDEISQQVSA